MRDQGLHDEEEQQSVGMTVRNSVEMTSAVEVFARAGDGRALGVLAAARLGGAAPKLRQLKDAPEPAALLGSLAPQQAVLTLLDGRWIAEPGAAAAAILPGDGGKWLAWEASVLRPAVLAAGQPDSSSSLSAALQLLATSLASAPWLAGAGSSTPGAADVVVYATLLPLLGGAVPSAMHTLGGLPAIAQWESRLNAVQAVADAKQQLLGEQSALDSLLACFAADAAAFVSSTPRLPKKGQRNILVTSALPYVNNVPHLGNIIGCVLSADCYARYCRQRGYNTVYVCGTDEYGTATETKALEEGLSCADLCDKYHAIHAQVYQWFDIQFDKFGRTPTRWQTRICQDMYEQLAAQGQIKEQTMEQLYSEALGKFLADRFVTGTCPKCKYEDARGDQCDNCGSLLNPTELINPKCKLTGTTPVIRSTRHLFLDLPKLSPELQRYQDTTSALGGWSSNCVQVTAAWMRDGLKSRCITRDLKWGTPVPRPGYEEKVFYVWFDAPVGYISITANYTPEWEQWWKNPQDVELVQFMGKDNVPFHTVIFPASLLGTGQAWTMMRSISVTEYLNYEGGKFSKSRGTGVFGTDAKDTGIPVEVWRYYLLSVRPEQQDTDFKWSDLQARNNSELLANIGNFINRGLQFVVKFFDGKVPQGHASKGAQQVAELSAAVKDKVAEYVVAMEKARLREGIRLAMLISADGNKFLQDTKPWVVVKEDPEHCGTIVRAALGVVRLLAALVSPFMPGFSRKVLEQLALPESALDLSDDVIAAASNVLDLAPPAGHAVGIPTPLISAISDETIAALRERFGGNQQERDAKAAAVGPSGKGASKAAGGDAKPAGGAKAPKGAPKPAAA